ncbi:MAG TPA: prolyl oligopeptidase family serine peptidase, partial [Chitinophagaceae bacterium]|nr:prolyl oligopeptidase family serine peptidase [Chitinophagaceae bacterium]
LWNEEHDTPDYPSPYGVMGWQEGDSAIYIYDKYDIWKIVLSSVQSPQNIFTNQKLRSRKTTIRYLRTDPEERVIKSTGSYFFRLFSEKYKSSAIWESMIQLQPVNQVHVDAGFSVGMPLKSRDAKKIIFTKENFIQSPDLYMMDHTVDFAKEFKLSSINPQQKNYNWGTAELIRWKAYNGKETEGIVFKPEDFDPKKKYPLICYFYETLSDGLNTYHAPSPTPSRLNISFFVSRGYVVFAPDIHYGTGHPARDAYNHIVSGARALVRKGYIDSTRIGIQGQSWGGIQVAQLITMTKLFKAAWAGAPVANMTSAYGGIRWESGLNRQFQYEKSQSRIGATLWEKPNLYIENSPLFHLPKVKTPLVIMHNDADGAVPWYQGIELFTGLRRLNKKVWMLNYNGEAHNLVERRNRKDIQVREQQYFDWLLKDANPPKWITEGVPALKKGKDWGLEY